MGNNSTAKRGQDSALSPKEQPELDFRPGKTTIVQQQSSLDDSFDEYHSAYRDINKNDDRGRPWGSPRTHRPDAMPTVFRWHGGGNEVFLSGTFNNWETKIPMVRSTNDFVAILELPEGEHEYKFLVDGDWSYDTQRPNVDNYLGSRNNVIKVEKSDAEVFDALALDSINSGEAASTGSPFSYKSRRLFDLSSSPPGEYGQEIASRELRERTSGPPILPPHLLQVILNKDVALQSEPTMLPEPNHVMLNHLYALSIKDGVMALSATHRYRKKYVTTLLYKPI